MAPLTRYTTSGPSDFGLAWSPDGKKLAFASSRALDGSGGLNGPGKQVFNIWVMNANGSDAIPLTRLTVSPGSGVSNPPAWSQDGTKLAFTSDQALDGSDSTNTNDTYNIWIVNADGSAPPVPVTQLVNGASSSPAWLPGSKLVFSSTRALDGTDTAANNSNIWVTNTDGSGASPLTRYSVAGVNADGAIVSPNGASIIFGSSAALDGSNATNTGASLNCWKMNADGSNPIPLTRYSAGSFVDNPAFSPDGTKIAFRSTAALDGTDAANPNATENLWLINADGSGAEPLTSLSYAGSGIETFGWSPDNTVITFTSDQALDGTNANSAVDNIWRINVNGTKATPLTRLVNTIASWPAWQP
jgi:Tol biopolymer transport system component